MRFTLPAMAETRPTRAKAADSAGESADAKETREAEEKREAEEREAAEKQAAEEEAAQKEAAKVEAGREEHTVEALIEGARNFFGCSPHIAAGALNGKAEKYTAAEAQDLIDAFLAVEYTP